CARANPTFTPRSRTCARTGLAGYGRRRLEAHRGRHGSRACAPRHVHRRSSVRAPAADRRAGTRGPTPRQRAALCAKRRPMNAGRSVAMAALLCSLALASGGCARNQGLDVRYPEAGVNRALLASVPPQRVGISPVVDRRLDTSRIGSLPKDGRVIVTRRPLSDTVRDALTGAGSRNGHAVLPDAHDVVLAAEVEEFWLDVVVGRSHAQYVSKVVLALAVVAGRSGETLFTRHYAGTKRREANADAKDVA